MDSRGPWSLSAEPRVVNHEPPWSTLVHDNLIPSDLVISTFVMFIHGRELVICRHDEKCLRSREERSRGSVLAREAHGHLPWREAERSLGSPEATDLSFRDVGYFS
ncbi:hypothetical protein CDL15_Pgr023978 [Punica granatum]|uniref:Uncharacterized protein n=1 Tax=Punica granatum TaxID=22663 RepID=A0A218WGK9_PUNGR|nr:hypothetical protein CDL15_Pgr023978 [Punica granatum]